MHHNHLTILKKLIGDILKTTHREDQSLDHESGLHLHALHALQQIVVSHTEALNLKTLDADSLKTLFPSIFSIRLRKKSSTITYSTEIIQVLQSHDAIGWAYQILRSYQRDQHFKRVLNHSAEKIKGRDIIPITQIYTPLSMVEFLVSNSLLAFRKANGGSIPNKISPFFLATSDRQKTGPKSLEEITVFDPACGTGNFLLGAFDQLFKLYVFEDSSRDPSEICRLILDKNLYGVDLDPTAVEISRGCLKIKCLQTVQTQPNLKDLAQLKISVHAITEKLKIRHNHLKPLTKSDSYLEWCLENFDEIGSLLNLPDCFDWASKTPKDNTLDFLEKSDNPKEKETIRALGLLGRKYDIVLINPPYLSNRQMGGSIRKFIRCSYQHTSEDLYACFIHLSERLMNPGGMSAIVCPQGWLTLKSFSKFRQRFLTQNCLDIVVKIGQRAFSEAQLLYIGLFVFQKKRPNSESIITALDLESCEKTQFPENLWRLCQSNVSAERRTTRQMLFSEISHFPILPFLPEKLLESLVKSEQTLGEKASIVAGIDTGENRRFVRYIWEVSGLSKERFKPYSMGKGYQKWAAPNLTMIDWENSGKIVAEHPGSTIRNRTFHFQKGFEYSYVYGGKVSCRRIDGAILDHGSVGVFPENSDTDGSIIFAFLNSRLANVFGRSLSSTLNLQVGCTKRFPFPAHLSISDKLHIRDLVSCCYHLKFHILEKILPDDIAFFISPTRKDENSSTKAKLLEIASLWSVLHVLEGEVEKTILASFRLDPEEQDRIFTMTREIPSILPTIHGHTNLPPRPEISTEKIRLSWKWAETIIAKRRFDIVPAEKTQSYQDIFTKFFQKNVEDIIKISPRKKIGSARSGVNIPIESFIDRASMELKIHPISVYSLLENLLEQSGHSHDKIERYLFTDWLNGFVLRTVHQRAKMGFVPLTKGLRIPSLFEMVPKKVQEDTTNTLRSDFETWFRQEFFKNHTKRFKNRPVIWQIQSSPSRSSEKPLVELLICFTSLTNSTFSDILRELIDPMLQKLETGRSNSKKLKEIKQFRSKLQEIVELRPGFDRNLGIRANIAPVQKAGLLAEPVLKESDLRELAT